MVKRLSIFIIAVFMVCGVLPTFAAEDIKAAISRLEPFHLCNMENLSAVVTRADAVSALVRLETGDGILSGDASLFTDVPPEHAAAGYITYAYRRGYVSGVSENCFAPELPVTLQQFTKMAISVLGYKITAERGGYPSGYNATAAKLGLFLGTELEGEAELAVRDLIILLNNMLDVKPMESNLNGDAYTVSEQTLYEILQERYAIEEYRGIVTAAGRFSLSGNEDLTDKQITVDGKKLYYTAPDPLQILGKQVVVRYLTGGGRTLQEVVTLYEGKNEEITVLAEDINTISRDSLVYNRTADGKDCTLRFDDAVFIYNGTKSETVSEPKTGVVRCVDNNADGKYEIVFIEEYESFVVDRVSVQNTTIYFKNDEEFRGKTGIKLDFDDADKKHTLEKPDGTSEAISSVEGGMAVSVYADRAEQIVRVIVSDIIAEGEITALDFGEHTMAVNNQRFALYRPTEQSRQTEYKVGQKGRFAINHKNEIVGTAGELFSERSYAYVMGFSGETALKAPKIKVVPAGVSEKVIETSGDDEIITYTYTNGKPFVLEFADRVLCTQNGVEQRLSADAIRASMLNRTVIYYKVNSENKISHLEIFDVPLYETAKLPSYYAYNFNGKLNSFGGYAAKNAFFVGETTRVICIPIDESPTEEDFGVDITISDKSSYTVMPVNINETDQIAACAVLYENMDAGSQKPLKSTDKVAIVGRVSVGLDEEGNTRYNLETLSGEKLDHPYLCEGSLGENIISQLRCGDLIRYNKKSNGEIGGIEYLESLSMLGDRHYINREGSETEAAYGIAESVTLNRLDNLRNERVDRLVLKVNGRSKTYVSPVEDGPSVYSYSRSTGAIRAIVTDEINSYERVGDGASDIFMLVNQNEPMVIVNLID